MGTPECALTCPKGTWREDLTGVTADTGPARAPNARTMPAVPVSAARRRVEKMDNSGASLSTVTLGTRGAAVRRAYLPSDKPKPPGWVVRTPDPARADQP